MVRPMRALGESVWAPDPVSYPSVSRLAAQNARAPSPIRRFASAATGPSVRTMKRKGWRFEPLGARVAAKRMSRSASSGMGSSV